jgi:mono/diheme cytochrome c family protein
MRLGIGLVILIVVLGVVSYLLFTGPYMVDQAHLRSFQARMPPTPAGVVPVSDPWPPVPSAEEAAKLTSPVAATDENRARGRIYYEYYCRSCHGDKGDGNGPVGESYDPKPADLRAAKVKALSDGELLRASLAGVGHEPVLGYTVLPQHRWYLVVYVRALGAAPAATAP